MIKHLVFTLIAIIVLVSLKAVAQNASSKSLLWRISGHGLTKPSYVFGAIDYICPADYLWTTSMQQCFDQCDKVCIPLNISDEAIKKEVANNLRDTKNKKLRDYFTPAEYTQVKNFTQTRLNLDLDKPALQAVKPLAIQPSIVKYLLGCTPAAYELRIIANAGKSNKKVVGLESATEALEEIEATRFNDRVAQILVEIAKGSPYYHDYRNNIEKAYQKQDIQSINALFRTTRGFSSTDFRIFLHDRAARWTTRMPAEMKNSSVFFALSPVNLWGDDGVINMLKKAGYTVEPVN